MGQSAPGISSATARDAAYDAALAYATAEGTAAGENAAEWWLQDTIGGRARPRSDRMAAGAIARGIADGDPSVLDILPRADLSGEWAGTLTGPQLAQSAILAAGLGDGEETDASLPDWFNDICDAYEAAFSAAAESAIAAACKAMLA